MPDTWNAVERYTVSTLHTPDPILDAALAASDAAGLPQIAVSEVQGKLLHLLARSIQAKRILEIGALGGYSTIWLARALPADGRIVSLEVNPTHALVARANLARASLSDRAEVLTGRALDLLPTLSGPFDLIFIDADKPSIPDYFREALRLSRPGAVIIVDNVVREGAVADPTCDDPAVLGVRRFNELVAAEPRVSATTLQTVGAKKHDGFAYVLVLP